MKLDDINTANLRFGPAEFEVMIYPLRAGRKTKAHTAFANLVWELWKNKVPCDKPANSEALTRIKCGIGPDRFSVYCDKSSAYIGHFQHGQQYWYRTGV